MVKIGLERIGTQKGVIVKVLLNSRVAELVISSECTEKQVFKLKKFEKHIYVRNMDSSFNREGPIKYTVEINIYYQGYEERMKIDVIGGQKWKVILEIPWIAYHNPEIDLRIGEDKVSMKMWKAVEIKVRNTGVVKTEGKREKERRRRRNEMRIKREKKRQRS